MELQEAVEVLEEVIEETAPELAEEVAELQAVEPVPFDEWIWRVLDLFSATLDYILSNPLLRFFAVSGLMFSAFCLTAYLVRSSRSLSH